MNSEKIELTRSEVNALTKIFLYLKFECEEVDSLFYCSSPIINLIFWKTNKNVWISKRLE